MFMCLNRGTAGAGLGLEAFVSLAAEAGFDGADVDLAYHPATSARAIRELYASRKMRFGGWGLRDWRDEVGKWEGMLEALPGLAATARELKIDTCSTWIAPSSERRFAENLDFHVRRLTPIARILDDHGLRLGLEFVSPYHLRRKFPHEFVFKPGCTLELADAIGPNVGLLVDCFHCHCSGTTWEEVARIPGERIVNCHINDAPRIALEQVQDQQRVLPGEGAIDLAGFITAVRRTGYNGPVSLEVFSAELKAMPPIEAARKAYAATKKVLGDLGV